MFNMTAITPSSDILPKETNAGRKGRWKLRISRSGKQLWVKACVGIPNWWNGDGSETSMVGPRDARSRRFLSLIGSVAIWLFVMTSGFWTVGT